jgi:hypothetical protein
MKTDIYWTYWTIYNEIDDRIYDGTPLFYNRKDAVMWFHKNDGRPSSMVIKVQVRKKD